MFGISLFFLESLERLLLKYRGLFEPANEQGSGEDTGNFARRWGIFSIISEMANLHNISINEATKLGAIEFLNWWAYLVEKQDYERTQRQAIR